MWKHTGARRPSFAIKTESGQESVWDYPRPPVCVPDTRPVSVRFGQYSIATTTHAVRVLETASPPTFYIPQADIDFRYLVQTKGASFCEWKGAATYWSLVIDELTIKDVGWSYEAPSPAFSSIAGRLAFYPAKLECRVNEQRVRPQPGGFYGGWVTDEIVGPYKGEGGTSGW